MGRFRDKGVPADNLSNYDSGAEQMLYVAPVSRIGQSKLLFVTEMSMCKLVDGAEFNVSKRTIASTKLTEGDRLIFVAPADEMEHVVLQSTGGSFLRFLKQEVTSMKKTAVGVRGMKLAEGDKLEHAYLLEGHKDLQKEINWNMHIFWKDIKNTRFLMEIKNIHFIKCVLEREI